MRYACMTIAALAACGRPDADGAPERPEVPPHLVAPPSRAPLDVESTRIAPAATPFADALGDPVEPDAAPPGSTLFAPDAVHRIDLEIGEDSLRALARDPRSDVLATFRMEDTRREVGIRLKGSYSFRDLDGKPGFKIDFGEFVEGQTLDRLRRLTLNNMVQDGTMIREHVVYRAYASVGVPATRHAHAEVWLNGEPYGVYGVLDAMDATWTSWAFPGDVTGWLYEGGGGADLLATRYMRFQVQARGVGEPHADLARLVAELDSADDVMDVLDARFDPSVFRMWATDLAAAHRDGYVRRRNNYLLFHGDASDRWWLVPWGNDQTFRPDDGHPYDGFFGRLLVDCARSERCMERLDDAVHDVADAWETQDLAGFADTTAARIAEACARDPRRESRCAPEGVSAFLDARPRTLREAAGHRP